MLEEGTWVRLSAFVDTDGSGHCEAGEPAGVWEGSFVLSGTDPTWRDIALSEEGGGFVDPNPDPDHTGGGVGPHAAGGGGSSGMCALGRPASPAPLMGVLALALLALIRFRGRRVRS